MKYVTSLYRSASMGEDLQLILVIDNIDWTKIKQNIILK